MSIPPANGIVKPVYGELSFEENDPRIYNLPHFSTLSRTFAQIRGERELQNTMLKYIQELEETNARNYHDKPKSRNT